MKKHIKTVAHHALRVAHHLRAKRIITKWKILSMLAICNMTFVLLLLIYSRSLPNTYIGHYPVGFKTQDEIKTILDTIYNAPLSINVHNYVYTYSYDRLGVYLDPTVAIAEIFVPNKTHFPKNIILFLRSLFIKRYVTVPLSFSQEYYAFIEKTIYDQNTGPDIVLVDQDEKSIALYEGKKRFGISQGIFNQLLVSHFGTLNEPIKAPLIELTTEIKDKVTIANTQLQFVYSQPLTIILRNQETDHFFTLSPKDLVLYTIATVSDTTGEVSFAIDQQKILPFLKKEIQNEQAYKKIYDGIASALTSRIYGNPTESVRVLLDSGPNTDGSLAESYIEVDISQQKMFTFKNNSLLKTYRVSTGKDYPTPQGTFKILNKATLGFSSIYNVWMPYWMAFSYSNTLGAYFGIHELPYYYTGDTKIQRPRNFIGSPNTGGCIALDIGDSKEVYQFASVGMPVVVNL